MHTTLRTLLMFQGRAEEALRFYLDVFDDAEIERIARFGPGEAGSEGSVVHATLRIGDQRVTCIDSAVQHPFTFTPATSLVVECDSDADVDALYARLSDGGQTLLPLAAYPFSQRFAWLTDRFGVSWQVTHVGA
jgi:predicted 3-demethylubiquinone-9 3-methyltransferase (glyoxalase superfamily)